MSWRSRNPAETRALGRGLAQAAAGAAGGLVVTLVGPLGAGKTVFAKGVAEGLGLDSARVASPTFVVAAEFDAPGGCRLVHADLYRIGDEAELEAAGWLDWLAPGTLLLVEWGDRFPEALPKDHLEVRIVRAPAPEACAAPDEGERRVEARAGGPAAAAVLARWRERCP
jgi:tRNA threonylcarbamoyladenosine biosynthesis protein TsaE